METLHALKGRLDFSSRRNPKNFRSASVPSKKLNISTEIKFFFVNFVLQNFKLLNCPLHWESRVSARTMLFFPSRFGIKAGYFALKPEKYLGFFFNYPAISKQRFFVSIFLHSVEPIARTVCASARTAGARTTAFTLSSWVADRHVYTSLHAL